jgi:predicted TIM-barrel fold metal-dependent hydrolase
MSASEALQSRSDVRVVDAHVHIGGLGIGGTGCFTSPKMVRSLAFRYLQRTLGFSSEDVRTRLDEVYLESLLGFIRNSPSITHALVFAHDAIFGPDGERNERLTQVYVPNEYVLKLASEHEELLPGVSVHPHRRDALDRVQECIERGAVALKWLPNSQGIDPADRKLVPIYDLLSEKRIPLVCHTGGEHTVRVLDPALSDPKRLELALERGVTVVCAHSGTRSGLLDRNYFRDFIEMARRWPNCYGDTSALATPSRAWALPKLAEMAEIHPKLLHGSDFPVPSAARWLFRHLPLSLVREIDRIANPLERDVRIKRAIGLPDSVFENAARLFLASRRP